MSDPRRPADRAAAAGPAFTPKRIVVWVLVGGIGLYLIATGIVGILVKASL